MDRIDNSQPSLPSKFVTLADLREQWLKQKELERQDKELQEQRKQRQDAKQNQQCQDIQSQQHHRGDRVKIRSNRNRFRYRYKDRESRRVASLNSVCDKQASSAVGTGVGFEVAEQKEKEKKAEKKPNLPGSGKEDKRMRPFPVEKEVVDEGAATAALDKKREMDKKKEKEEYAEISRRCENEGPTSSLEVKSKNFVKGFERKFGKLSMSDKRNDRFTRSYSELRYRDRGYSGRGFSRNHLDKQMAWVRKDGVSSASADASENARSS